MRMFEGTCSMFCAEIILILNNLNAKCPLSAGLICSLFIITQPVCHSALVVQGREPLHLFGENVPLKHVAQHRVTPVTFSMNSKCHCNQFQMGGLCRWSCCVHPPWFCKGVVRNLRLNEPKYLLCGAVKRENLRSMYDRSCDFTDVIGIL